ncbi:MAG: acetyl-CoA carboxylase biotin carboxyl carrier protein, partial [Cytophagales bacterium]|nr:acetyl-CoA carboxylase biotin carboxyl carrier protein [Cytophagales bacterium]
NEFKIAVKKSIVPNVTKVEQVALPAAVAQPQVIAAPVALPVAKPAVAEPAVAATPAPSSSQKVIKSPMIGTFYASASPESDVFVKLGDTISVGQTVCIIEAMKLFNEIESEFAGKIVKILVENATPVEYDQPLFIVE